MVKSKRHKERKWTFPVPRGIFIQACNETGKHFDMAADSWGEKERYYLRELCGEQYRLLS